MNNTGNFCWVELASNKLRQSQNFYTKLFGWTMDQETMPDGNDYTMMQVDSTPIAGAMQINDEMKAMIIPACWSCYVEVDDVKVHCDKALSLGGKIMLEPMDVGEFGVMAVLSDCCGAIICLWQPKEKSAAQTKLPANTPSTCCWYELMTINTDKAQHFYHELFGWTYVNKPSEAMDGSDYILVYNGKENIGGMMQMSEAEQKNIPPHWGIYFAVANFDTSLNLAKELGAEAMFEPIDYPKVGIFTNLKEPNGAHFSIIEVRH